MRAMELGVMPPRASDGQAVTKSGFLPLAYQQKSPGECPTQVSREPAFPY
jgi:hypothetical protein